MKRIVSCFLALVMILGVLGSLVSCDFEISGTIYEVHDSLLMQKELQPFDIPETFKIGMICLHDEDSTYDLNFINAIQYLKGVCNLSDEQVIIERNVPEDTSCYEKAIDLVNKGCKIIFADSFGHESYLLQAARENPTVEFCHATGTMAHTSGISNFHNAFAAIYEGRFLAGVAAGMKLNELKEEGKLKGSVPKIGYVGAFTYAEVISGYTSFYLGAKSVCPDVIMSVQFTGSWYDENEESNAAKALIASGCDLISQHADSLGAPTACEDAGIPNVSYNGSTFYGNETTFLISSAINWTAYFEYLIKAYINGDVIPSDWTGTVANGAVVLSGVNVGVAAEGTEDALKSLIEQFKAGTYHVFDTSKDNFITVDGKKLDSYLADVDTDPAYAKDTEVVWDGYFHESEKRSAPYFDIQIDGVTLVNSAY